MRPIKLTMTAFGPYRDAETIDFDKLEDRRLFVITGNTGAGKTTIFDAICYALYDSASGEDRSETRMLRSHYADDDVHTSVDLLFAAGRRTYRIFRQMGHRKGGNKSETGEKVELYEYESASGRELPLVDRFLKKEVNERLEAILGLTKEQFSQIVMLPQGEFRKLLTSDTDNKEDILRHIFGTQFYARLENRFQERSKALREQHRDARSRLDMQMAQVREALPARDEGELRQTLEQEFRSAAQVADGLAREADHYEALARSAEARKTAAAEEQGRQETALREALVVNGRFEELAAKRRQLAELELARPAIGEKERLLELADHAARIEPYDEYAHRAAQEAGQKQEQAAAKQLALEAAALALAKAEAAHREEEAREPERKAAELELQRLKEMMPVVQSLAARRSELDGLLAEERAHREQLARIDGQLAEQRESRQTIAAQLRESEADIASLPDKLRALEQARRRQALLQELARLELQLRELALAEAARDEGLASIRAEHDRLEQRWLEGQAGLLAAHLHDGEPCPVCGSTAHPDKASAGDDLPSREALQLAKEELRHLERELSEVRGQAAAARAGWDHASAAAAEHGLASAHAAERLADVDREAQSLRVETERLERQRSVLAERREAADKLERAHEALLLQREAIAQQSQRLALDIGKRQSVLESELSRLPEPLRSPPLLERRLAEQQLHFERLAEAWKQAEAQLRQLATRAAEERANAEQLEAQWKEAEAKRQEAAERFARELGGAGFATSEAYEAARLPAPTRQAYKLEAETFRRTVATLAQQVAELEEALADKRMSDLAALQQAVEAAMAEVERVQLELQTALRYRQEADRLRKAVLAAHEQARELEAALAQVLDIYQTMKGDNPLKISFERYILIEFLEQILQAANIRLRKLSNGQYMLRRSDRLETRGKQSGLGLDVYDAYTGQNRDVKSLSGGEKFNASLCLALGMTDVIQAHQGGVSIEMMFIDEGFGSLDEDSLNKAIATLVDLQRAGRMIGVISHVQELKQAFPAVLEVVKTREGYSRTAIIVK